MGVLEFEVGSYVCGNHTFQACHSTLGSLLKLWLLIFVIMVNDFIEFAVLGFLILCIQPIVKMTYVEI